MIYYITPYSPTKRYGKAINAHIECLPDDSWICLRDMDTMFLTPDAGTILEEAIIDHPDCVLFTCATNRAYRQQMSEDSDIINHCKEAKNRKEWKRYTPVSGVLPAFLWLFPKSTWQAHPFDNYPIIHRGNSFDTRWCRGLNGAVRGKKLRIEHLYVFHLYRLDREEKSHSHLI